jgi:hypothetical protein
LTFFEPPKRLLPLVVRHVPMHHCSADALLVQHARQGTGMRHILAEGHSLQDHRRQTSPINDQYKGIV